MSKIYQSHQGFDIESEIVKGGNLPSPVNLSVWQERIDGIVGTTLSGKSKLRIVWGQSQTIFVCGRQRMAYPFWRVEDDHGEVHDIGTPRFYVEELHDLAELKRDNNWENSRWQWEGLERIDVLGPIPDEGFYTAVFTVAHHDSFCCDGKEVANNTPCLGAYRPPTDSDLSRIRKMLFRRNNASRSENAPSADLIQKWNREMGEKRDERFREQLHERVKNWVAVHGHRITDSMNYKQLSRGKFKFMPTTAFNKETTNDRTSDSNSAAA